MNSVVLHPNQAELISGDQNGSVRVWDLTAGACSRELVPEGEVRNYVTILYIHTHAVMERGCLLIKGAL